ncbi:inactive serine/threonine-protein kinase [Salix suchowensis]|nr:inactive serine/threonine-protein kinase [Salix suchowensis]
MEKIQGKKKRQEQKQNQKNLQASNKALVWDCGSALYDSFELKSFERQLDSAMNSRTLSMPHLPDRRKPSKISRSLNKFLKSMFKSKQNPSTMFRFQERLQDDCHVVYDKSGALTTIPEVPEIDFGGFSPEINSLVRKTVSDRFTAASIGISCA